MVNIFQPIVDRQKGVLKAASWYKNAIGSITNRAGARTLMKSGKLNVRPSAGRLNFYFYDPKGKKTLPYYDIFPLVLPIDTFRGGFVGLNFHYLPYALRFKLLQELQRYASNTDFDRTTVINASYNTLKNIGLIKPTIKKYLWKHIRSNFLKITADEMAIAVYLPVQQFRKATTQRVFADSRRAV